MTTSEHSEIQAIIGEVFVGAFGGRASTDEVFRATATSLPDHLRSHLLSTGLKTAIRGYFRKQRTDGLPQAPEASADGTHVQLDLLELDEFRYVIERQLKASDAARAQAVRLAELCATIHGVSIPLDLIEAAS